MSEKEYKFKVSKTSEIISVFAKDYNDAIGFCWRKINDNGMIELQKIILSANVEINFVNCDYNTVDVTIFDKL